MGEFVRVSGPVFDGRAAAAAAAYADATEEVIGREGVNRVLSVLGEVIQHPTGVYEAAIHTERQADDLVVTDEPVIYGPWLEGVGSRNYPATKFKGYATFRKVSERLDGEAGALAAAGLLPYLGAMNE